MILYKISGSARSVRIDAILVDRLAALDLVKKPKGTLAVTGDAFFRVRSALRYVKATKTLLKAVDNAIAEMQKMAQQKRSLKNGLALA